MSLFAGTVIGQLACFTIAVLAAIGSRTTGARNLSTGVAAIALGVCGMASGVVALSGAATTVSLPTALPAVTLVWEGTPLGGIFAVIAGVVVVICTLYGIGYAHGPASSRTGWAAYAVFVLGMQIVPLAGDVVGLLIAWEVMAIGSSILVVSDHAHRPGVRKAGLWYAVMTHLSFLLLAAGLGVLAASAGSVSFPAIATTPRGGTSASIAFLLAVLGFATKAGAVPLHIWLPRAHPEAPSHVSALMSAVMVKMGIYGVLLLTTRLLPYGPSWWALVVLGLGIPSALYGILQASVASDLKRLLAYSTTENVGLILIALAVAMLTRQTRAGVSAVALIAVFLLIVSHAAFKTTLFLAAGSILHRTGERDLDRMGGLAARMPVTTIALAIGALGAAALPATSGFIAEWSLLQSLIHADGRTDRLTTAVLPFVMGVVALTAGLALLTFTKAFGIAALARPRSDGAASATESPRAMRAALLLAASLVVALGLIPGVIVSAISPALPEVTRPTAYRAALVLPGAQATLDPTALVLLALVVTLPLVTAGWALARRVPRQRSELAWGCGGVRTSPRMQYTATSYAEPLVRIFDDALAPTRDISVTHAEESRFTVRAMAYSQRVVDVIEARGYAPLVQALARLGDWGRSVHNGSIHRYLAFSFAALLVVLLGVLR